MSKKQLYTLEYPVRCSPSILFEFLSTPAGLGEWFADKVDENKEHVFTFTWNDSSEKAQLLDMTENKSVRFHWLHAPKEEYFEFEIEKSEVTNQTILVIKDFAEKKEIKDQSQLWEYQVKDLFHRIGA
ncbi:MAG TPA: START-like domain-containing protein [Segetibacter sp.]|nr:START-like domain-containing protein [Segetibacter sp.]